MHASPPPSGGHMQPTSLSSPIQSSAQVVVDEELLGYLRKVPLLAKLSSSELRHLGSRLFERTFRNGYRMIVEGDVGHHCFIIKQGGALVRKWDDDEQCEVELCQLHKGDYFGETALLHNSHRGATVIAMGTVTCFLLASAEFKALFGNDRLNVTFNKRAAVNAALQGHVNDDNLPGQGEHTTGAPIDAIREKNPQTISMLSYVIMNSMLFNNFDDEQRRIVIDAMWLQHCETGQELIQQGDIGEHWYVVDSGRFDIYISKSAIVSGGDSNSLNLPPSKVGSRDRGTAFGELALLYNAPRQATIKAAMPSDVWVLDRATFRSIITQAASEKSKKIQDFLRKVTAFSSLSSSELDSLSECLEEITFDSGHVIIHQGSDSNNLFWIQSGEVKVTKNENGRIIELTRLREGDHFGELGLMKHTTRAATCTAVGVVRCLYLKHDDFQRLGATFQSLFNPSDKSAQAAAAKSRHKEKEKERLSASHAPRPSKPSAAHALESIRLEDLQVLGVLGKGSFGFVQLVKDNSGNTYALKVVSKQLVVQLGQQEHILNEKRTMLHLHHPFLVRLHSTFQDADCVYFLLEASLGGELFTILRQRTSFSESTARFYAAGVVLAFQYMHAKGIIYRDLKPENLLLDSKGYIKLTDFGFAKYVGDGRTFTFCGTQDYLAPEVLSGQGYGKGVDWWTLGILIYEMLAGYPPFADQDPMRVCTKIITGVIQFPINFSKSARDLIRKLLHPRAAKRLGCVGGAAGIKSHPWFAGFDWAAFLARRLPAPILPSVRSQEDLSNFKKQDLEQTKTKPYTGDKTKWEEEF